MLAIFDVEGVLYDAEYLPLLAEKVNKEKKIWEITKKGIEGKIDWVEGLKERVHLLRGMDYDTCIQVANSLPIMTGAKEACRVLKNAGWKIMAVSGGFTIITDRLKKELDLSDDKYLRQSGTTYKVLVPRPERKNYVELIDKIDGFEYVIYMYI